MISPLKRNSLQVLAALDRDMPDPYPHYPACPYYPAPRPESDRCDGGASGFDENAPPVGARRCVTKWWWARRVRKAQIERLFVSVIGRSSDVNMLFEKSSIFFFEGLAARTRWLFIPPLMAPASVSGPSMSATVFWPNGVDLALADCTAQRCEQFYGAR